MNTFKMNSFCRSNCIATIFGTSVGKKESLHYNTSYACVNMVLMFRPMKLGGTLYSRVLYFCSDHLKNWEELCIRVCSRFFSFFPTKNQLPQIIIGER